MHRIDLTPVYVLHTRPYSNTSLIIELFSKSHGRVSAVARSARGPKSRYQGKLQLFTPILASWFGNHELKTLSSIELDGMPHQLNQKSLFCGFYLNELLMRLLHKEDAHSALFSLYQECLCRFEKNDKLAPTLRLFEKRLLAELGYGLPLVHEAGNRKPIQPDNYYRFECQQGFFKCDRSVSRCFLGADLLAIEAELFESDVVATEAKRLMREVILNLLGNKVLHSRALF